MPEPRDAELAADSAHTRYRRTAVGSRARVRDPGTGYVQLAGRTVGAGPTAADSRGRVPTGRTRTRSR